MPRADRPWPVQRDPAFLEVLPLEALRTQMWATDQRLRDAALYLPARPYVAWSRGGRLFDAALGVARHLLRRPR